MKSHVAVEKSQFLRLMPEEIVVEILSRLPFESLHKFKWVSKSWRSLITGEILPRTLNTSLLGFIYGRLTGRFTYISITRDDDGDTAIDLVFPLFPGGFSILNCCNGLVLSRYIIRTAPTYVVCNPFTKSWTQLPLTDYSPSHNFIDFDPSISPHYKVVAVWGRRNQVFINVYRSETGRWEQKRMNLRDCVLRDYRWSALWDGDLYVHAYCKVGSLINSWSGGGYETVRIGLSGGDNDFELIKFPKGSKKPLRGMHVGRLGDGRLCSVRLDGLHLWVWTLRGKCESEWVLEHDSTIPGLSGLSGCHPLLIVGFHPLRNAVLLLYKSKSVVFAYDLMEMSLIELCRIGKEGEGILSTSVFPFVPCSYDMLEKKIEMPTRK